MSKSLRNGIIIIVVLLGIFFIIQNRQQKRITKSSPIFTGDKADIVKVLIQKGDKAIELARVDTSWEISGNDTLEIRQNRIDNLLNKVLDVERETLVSANPDKWETFSIDDSTGTHLALINANDDTIGYFVFGRSKSDWSHNYIRFKEGPEVYLTSENVISSLNTGEKFWGQVPKPPPVKADSLGTAPEVETETPPPVGKAPETGE